MAIVFAMEHYKIYLYGKEFVVRTDHRPLQWLKDLKNSSNRLARWLIIMEQIQLSDRVHQWLQNEAAVGLLRYFIHSFEGEEEVEEPGVILYKIQTVSDTYVESSEGNLKRLRRWITQ